MPASTAVCFRRRSASDRHWSIKSNVPSFSAATPLSPPSVIAALNPHRLSHAPMASRVCRSSSTTRMRRMNDFPCGIGTACRQPRSKEDGLIARSRGEFLPCESVHYRISAANRRAVCPAQCIRMVRQPDAIGPAYSHPSRYRAARAIVDAAAFTHSSLMRCPSGVARRCCALRAGIFGGAALPSSRNGFIAMRHRMVRAAIRRS